MKTANKLSLLMVLLLAAPLPVAAQVEKVVANVEGIDCESCAVVMEYELHKIEGVDRVAISMQRQMFAAFLKPDATFRPKEMRAAVAKTDVSVVQFRLQAKGIVAVEGDKQFFVAGKDRFLLVDSPTMPLNTPLFVGGDVDDETTPYELKVVDFKPL